jgi:hypothetical protein
VWDTVHYLCFGLSADDRARADAALAAFNAVQKPVKLPAPKTTTAGGPPPPPLVLPAAHYTSGLCGS